ncbi:MAG: hypothetical protein ABIR11_13740 [Candidatus Limnocylindrales bacterium]
MHLRVTAPIAAWTFTIGVALVIASCGSAAPSPVVTSQPTPGEGSAWLRLTITQAIPPIDQFAIGPAAVITGDGVYVTAGPIPAIFPGPVMPNLVGRRISDTGRARIIDEARRLGLLAGQTDFTGGAAVPGAMMARIELSVGGAPVVLTGDPNAQVQCITTPCDAPPGTPAAFAALWSTLAFPDAWLGRDLGPEGPFVAGAYALLIGAAPVPQAGLGARLMDWPLDVPLATFGVPVASGTARCGIASGADADVIRPSLERADQLTQWVQDPTTSATFGITIRPIIAGEDPCAEAFGGG